MGMRTGTKLAGKGKDHRQRRSLSFYGRRSLVSPTSPLHGGCLSGVSQSVAAVRTHSHTDQNVSVLQAAATLATNMRMDRTKTKSRDLWCEESSFSFFIAGEKMRTRWSERKPNKGMMIANEVSDAFSFVPAAANRIPSVSVFILPFTKLWSLCFLRFFTSPLMITSG